jgi:hypothetical protein
LRAYPLAARGPSSREIHGSNAQYHLDREKPPSSETQPAYSTSPLHGGRSDSSSSAPATSSLRSGTVRLLYVPRVSSRGRCNPPRVLGSRMRIGLFSESEFGTRAFHPSRFRVRIHGIQPRFSERQPSCRAASVAPVQPKKCP